MNLFRIATFASALVILVVGIVASHSIITSTFHKQGTSRPTKVAGAATTATPLTVVEATAPPKHRHAVVKQNHKIPSTPRKQRGRPMLIATPIQVVANQPAVSLQKPQTLAGLPFTSTSRSTTSFALRPKAPQRIGETEPKLTNYWVGTRSVHRGQMISFDYVIDNPTNEVVHLSLGASIKPEAVKNWAVAMSDPRHDVVAAVLPGKTMHLRYFQISRTLDPGIYDVAWGLRDAVTGQRVALSLVRAALLIGP